MDQKHRGILTKKRVELVDNIANPQEVVDALFSGGILTDDLKEQIQARPKITGCNINGSSGTFYLFS